MEERACNVEGTLLGDRDHIIRWATILASVAIRILRMTYLARTQPETPADIEFSREEIDATIFLRRPGEFRRGQTPTIGQVTTEGRPSTHKHTGAAFLSQQVAAPVRKQCYKDVAAKLVCNQ